MISLLPIVEAQPNYAAKFACVVRYQRQVVCQRDCSDLEIVGTNGHPAGRDTSIASGVKLNPTDMAAQSPAVLDNI